MSNEVKYRASCASAVIGAVLVALAGVVWVAIS